MYNHKAVKHYDEGRALQQAGNLSGAERAYNKAIKINANFVEAYINLGNVLLDRGRPREAGGALRKALKFQPKHPLLLNNLGNALQLQGEYSLAVDWFGKAVDADPQFAGAHSNLGNALRDLGRYAEAVLAYQRAIELNPGFADSYSNLGSVLADMGEFEQAVANYQQCIAIDPNHPEAYNGLGNALAYIGEIDTAIAAYRNAIAINSNHKDAQNGLGNVLSDIGEIDDAIEAYRRAIEIQPNFADAYRSLAKNKKFVDVDADVQAMEALYATPKIPDSQKMYLAFGLGKAYEDLGEYHKSMELILTGASLKRASYSYAITEAEQLFNDIKGTFSAGFFSERDGVGDPDQTPVFILGMPRSGTSLVEQILASHPNVYGAGELSDLSSLTAKACAAQAGKFPVAVSELYPSTLAGLGRDYVARLRKHAADTRHVTDKMPHNFHYIGLIKTVLPNARIINCLRDPMDNCLSIFKNYFSSGHLYSYDLTELGQYYRLYQDLMAHWHQLLPGAILDLTYEDLIADQETQIRRLLAYCDLPWDDACLKFYKTRRKVRTASNAQVRQPIYRDSVKLWKRYEQQLQPLHDAIYG